MSLRVTGTVWVVVKVASGIPVMAEAWDAYEPARKREDALRRSMHPENDETAVFEIPIRCARTERL